MLHNSKLDEQISLFIVAVLDYIAADILKVSGRAIQAWNQCDQMLEYQVARICPKVAQKVAAVVLLQK